ncbi:MAG: pyridoxal phosphate-dependent aminotransferase, partial [Ktedonobacterales bacterium]
GGVRQNVREEQRYHDFGAVAETLRRYELATGQPVLALSGWEVEDRRIQPPAPLLDRLMRIPPRLLGYSHPHDFAQAKALAAEALGWRVTLGGARLRGEQIAVLQNSTQGLLLALAALRARDVTRIVIAAPSYFAAVDACHHLGLQTTILPARDFLTGALDVERIAATLRGDPTAALLLTNPAYSLGVEYGWDQLRALFAALPEEAPVLLDETRLGIAWTGETPWYAADYPASVLVLRSPSKIFLVNGLKTSFLYGSAPIIRDVERLHEALLGSVAGNAEAVALAYLDTWRDWLAELEQDRDGPMRQWRRALVRRLSANLTAVSPLLAVHGYDLSPINSGPYVLAGARRGAGTGSRELDCARVARELGILLMDGRYFFHESPSWTGFRLNLCGDPSRACTALDRLFPTFAGVSH